MIDYRRTGVVLLLLLESSILTGGFVAPETNTNTNANANANTNSHTNTAFSTSSSSIGSNAHIHGRVYFLHDGSMIRKSDVQLYMSSRFNLRSKFKTFIAPQSQPQSQPSPPKTPPPPSSVVNMDMNIPRIQVKPRPLVSLDESTGRYIRTNDTPSSASESNTNTASIPPSYSSTTSNSYNGNGNGNDDYNYPQVSGWDYFKDLVYDTIDAVSGIPTALGISSQNKRTKSAGGTGSAFSTMNGSGSRNSGNSNNGNSNSNSILDRKLAVAYSDTVEFKTNNNSNPLDSIQKTLTFAGSKANVPKSKSRSINNNNDGGQGREQLLVQQYESSLSASNKDRSDGEDLFKSDARKSFDGVKDGIYDLFSGGNNKKGNDNTVATTAAAATASGIRSSRTSPLDKLSSSTTTLTLEKDSSTFKPPSKPSTNQDSTIQSLTPYLTNLNSPNPLKVLEAKFAIAAEERKRKRRLQQQAQREAIDGIKRGFYDAVDTVQSMYETVVSVPDKVEEAVVKVEVTLEQSVEEARNTVREVQAIPGKVQKAVEDTKKSVEDTKRATIEVVEEVRSIPMKVENKVAETKQSIQETKEGVEKVVKQVEDLTFEAKVLAGLEQPKPKPPPPPPPPKTNSEIALDVAGVVAKTTGQAAVVVGKGTISLSATAAKAAFNAAAASVEKGKKDNDENGKGKGKATSLLSKFTNTVNNQKKKKEAVVKVDDVLSNSAVVEAIETQTTPKTTTIGEIDPILELEVADALKSAEEALVTAKKEKENPKTKLTSMQIKEALENARTAAAAARKDAEDLEVMLQKKKELFYKP